MRIINSMLFRWRLATADHRILPEFLVIGAAKSGTTFLHKYLSKHPQVIPPSKKEVHYFDDHYTLGLYWYKSHFPLNLDISLLSKFSNKKTLPFETTPNYLYHPAAPERIHQLLPDGRFIVLLRNPVNRAVSHYHMIRSQGYEHLSIQDAFDAEQERIDGEAERLLANPYYHSRNNFLFSYLARGIYIDQLLRWERFFSSEQLLIINSETLFNDPNEQFEEICDFLGITNWYPTRPKKTHAGRYAEVEACVRERLQEYFLPHNRRLFDHLGVEWDWNQG